MTTSTIGLFTRLDQQSGVSAESKSKPRSIDQMSDESLHQLGERGVAGMNRTARHPHMKPTGSKHPRIYILGEAPGKTEDERGVQFVGSSGKILRAAFDSVKDELRFNNCCRTRPINNDTPTRVHIECYRPSIVEDIERTKPPIIVGTGAVPLDWMLPQIGTITVCRGRRFPVQVGSHQCWFYPIVHPAYILRVQDDERSKPPGPEIRRTFDRDIRRIIRDSEGELPEPYVEPTDDASLDQGVTLIDGSGGRDDLVLLRKLLERMATEKFVSMDSETNRLRPYSPSPKVLSMSMSTYARTVSFAVDHPQSKWGRCRDDMLEIVWWFLTTQPRKVWHNLGFDLEWVVHLFGTRAARVSRWEDGMQQAYVLDERIGGHGLDFVCRETLGLRLKNQSNLNRAKLEDAPLHQVLRYNAFDSKYLHKAFRVNRRRVRDEGLVSIYREQVRRVPTCVLSQRAGLPVHQRTIRRLSRQYARKLRKIEARIRELPEVKQYRKRFGEFNPHSPNSVAILLRDVMKETAGQKNKGRYSTNEAVLNEIGGRVPDSILLARKCAKMRSTYIAPLDIRSKETVVYPDGLLHTVFNTTFTTTGRLSSDSPNMQNFPKRDPQLKLLRRAIRAPEGYWIVAMDHGQIEYRGIGWCTKDRTIVDSTWNNYDVHMELAEKVASKWPACIKDKFGSLDKNAMKAFRGEVKNKWTFPAFYLAQMEYIASLLGMPVRVFAPLFEWFWEKFKGVKIWQNDQIKFYQKHNYVETLTGRRRHGPMSINDIVNSPPQGTASDVVIDGMNRLSETAYQKGMKHLRPLQARINIHDDLTFLIPKKGSDSLIEAAVLAMLDVPYDFINTPLQVEVEIGTNWYDMKHLGKFQSHELLPHKSRKAVDCEYAIQRGK